MAGWEQQLHFVVGSVTLDMLRGLKISGLWVSSVVFWLLKTLHFSAPSAQNMRAVVT